MGFKKQAEAVIQVMRAVAVAMMALTVAAVIITPGRAERLDDALTLLKQGNIVKAIEQLLPLAEAGSAEAQFQLASIYRSGVGIPQDYSAAAKWLLRAAQTGHANSQNEIGRMYFSGLGVERDDAEALRWLTAAAEKGNSSHQYDLATSFETGIAGPPDPGLAAKWYTKAAESGLVDAIASLGLLHYQGRGVEQDMARAFELLTAAANKGDARAQNNLGLMYVRGEGTTQDYTEAAKWFTAAANQGLSKAMTNLGVMYDNGFGVPQDDNKAIELYRLGGATSSIDAKQKITGTQFVYDPRFAPIDPETATPDAFAVAAGQGDPVALFLMAYVYSGAAKIKPDYVKAAELYLKAAESGLPAAMANLGLMHIRGQGVPQDYVYGYMWASLAAAAGLVEAVQIRDSIASSLNPEQINEARNLALQQQFSGRD